MMIDAEQLVQRITKVDTFNEDGRHMGIVKFDDGSELEIAFDGVFTYPMTRTRGFAEYVGVYELQLVNFHHLSYDSRKIAGV